MSQNPPTPPAPTSAELINMLAQQQVALATQVQRLVEVQKASQEADRSAAERRRRGDQVTGAQRTLLRDVALLGRAFGRGAGPGPMAWPARLESGLVRLATPMPQDPAAPPHPLTSWMLTGYADTGAQRWSVTVCAGQDTVKDGDITADVAFLEATTVDRDVPGRQLALLAVRPRPTDRP